MSGAVGAVTSVNAVTREFEQLVHKNTSSYMYVVLNLFVIQHKIALLKNDFISYSWLLLCCGQQMKGKGLIKIMIVNYAFMCSLVRA